MNLIRAVEVLCRVEVMSAYHYRADGNVLFQEVVAYQGEGVFVEQPYAAVIEEVGVFRREEYDQDNDDAEIARHERVDKQLAEDNAEQKRCVAGEQTYAVALAKPLPADDKRNEGRAYVEVCAEINRLVQRAVVIACFGVDREYRRRPRGGESQKHADGYGDKCDDTEPPPELAERSADL